MIWDKFRRTRGDEKPDSAPPPVAEDDSDEVEGFADGDPEAIGEREPWGSRATAVIPGGSSTGSKRPEALYGDAPLDQSVPTHYSRARGCSLFLVDGESELEVVDCTMALGSVAIGYADSHATAVVAQALQLGNVGGVPNALEVTVAERMCDFIPCAEQVRFLKSGAEAVSAAVRIARTYTGRDRVVCAGYFGWHDWASGADVAGIPAGVRADVARVPFDDLPALERAVREAGSALAAIVIEPVVERLPSSEWIARARALATDAGAVLVFDEMKTGFRLKPGGYGELSGVEPDLAVFGKALANGFPLSAVVGRADVMDAARRTWISSTLAGETLGLAAAHAVLDWHEKEDVCGTLATVGAAMRGAVERAIIACGLPGIGLSGLDQMWKIDFADPAVEAAFLRNAVPNGALFKRGAYNYAALAHEDAIGDIESAASAALVAIREGQDA
jgi:glutamate-1-semialdehyde aminotransferase